MIKRTKKATRDSKPIPPPLFKMDISVDPKSLRTGAEIRHVAQDTEDLNARKTTVRDRLISGGEILAPPRAMHRRCNDAGSNKSSTPSGSLVNPILEDDRKDGRVLDGSTQKEWLDDTEQCLRSVISRFNPAPVSYKCVVDRDADELTVYTVWSAK
jgi:hypothetical protein